MVNTDLSPLELHALMIAGKPADKVRDRLAEGNGQEVDINLRITGAVNVGLATEADTVESVKATTLLAIVLESLSKRVKRPLIEIVQQKCQDFVAGGGAPEITKEAAAEAQDLVAACSRPALQKRRGAVTGALKVERVD